MRLKEYMKLEELEPTIHARFASILVRIPQVPQRQDGSKDQLADLVQVANKLGMYDAADVIKTLIRHK